MVEFVEIGNGEVYWVEDGYESENFPNKIDACLDYLTRTVIHLRKIIKQINLSTAEANRKLNLIRKEKENGTV